MRNNREEFLMSKSKIDMSNLKLLREEKRYSQIKLQHLVGVSTSSIEAYEQGVRIPSLPVALRLSEVLGCSLDYLVGRTTDFETYFLLSKDDKDKVLNFIEELHENSIHYNNN